MNIRKLLFLSLILVLTASCGSTPPQKDIIDYFSKEEVKEVPGISADDLYYRAMIWVSRNFNSADVIQFTDRDNHTIVAKGIMPDPMGNVHFTLSIYTKEGRYKYTFDDFYHKATHPRGISGGSLSAHKPKGIPYENWNKLKKRTLARTLATIESLEQSLQKSIGTDGTTSW